MRESGAWCMATWQRTLLPCRNNNSTEAQWHPRVLVVVGQWAPDRHQLFRF